MPAGSHSSPEATPTTNPENNAPDQGDTLVDPGNVGANVPPVVDPPETAGPAAAEHTNPTGLSQEELFRKQVITKLKSLAIPGSRYEDKIRIVSERPKVELNDEGAWAEIYDKHDRKLITRRQKQGSGKRGLISRWTRAKRLALAERDAIIEGNRAQKAAEIESQYRDAMGDEAWEALPENYRETTVNSHVTRTYDPEAQPNVPTRREAKRRGSIERDYGRFIAARWFPEAYLKHHDANGMIPRLRRDYAEELFYRQKGLYINSGLRTNEDGEYAEPVLYDPADLPATYANEAGVPFLIMRRDDLINSVMSSVEKPRFHKKSAHHERMRLEVERQLKLAEDEVRNLGPKHENALKRVLYQERMESSYDTIREDMSNKIKGAKENLFRLSHTQPDRGDKEGFQAWVDQVKRAKRMIPEAKDDARLRQQLAYERYHNDMINLGSEVKYGESAAKVVNSEKLLVDRDTPRKLEYLQFYNMFIEAQKTFTGFKGRLDRLTEELMSLTSSPADEARKQEIVTAIKHIETVLAQKGITRQQVKIGDAYDKNKHVAVGEANRRRVTDDLELVADIKKYGYVWRDVLEAKAGGDPPSMLLRGASVLVKYKTSKAARSNISHIGNRRR